MPGKIISIPSHSLVIETLIQKENFVTIELQNAEEYDAVFSKAGNSDNDSGTQLSSLFFFSGNFVSGNKAAAIISNDANRIRYIPDFFSGQSPIWHAVIRK